ncbi:MAG: carbohydrate-binding domain-containing protein [Bacteroidales bacterium]|nr:carbohydrate-binding domain-containing protein [Bacteroidales bacterium]
MKKILLFFTAILCCMFLKAQEKMYIHKSDNMILGAPIAATDSIFFDNTQTIAYFVINDSITEYPVSSIDSITFGPNSDTVFITFNGQSTSIENPYAFEGITVNVNGGKVIINSTIQTSDIYYMLSGTTSDGNFKIYSDKRFNLLLNGVTMTNPTGPAINVQTGSKVSVTLLSGTTSSLTDGINYAVAALDSLGFPEDQKAAFFSEGQVLFGGTGSLTITGKGNAQHALCSDDYLQFDEGAITVVSAVKDGIHGREGIFINGGTLQVTAAGDAIDAELGELFISGGQITTTNAAADSKALTCDSTLTISGGTLHLSLSGNQSKGIKSRQQMTLSGGYITINTTGMSVLEASGSGFNPSYCAAIKCDSNITINGSNIVITATGKASKGISCDKNINMLSGVLKITCSGIGATYTNSSGQADAYTATCISTNGNLSILGDSVTLSNSGSGGKGISTDGFFTVGDASSSPYVKITTSGSRITISNGNYAEAKAITSDGAVTINTGYLSSTSTDDGIKSTTSVTINNGTIIVNSKEGIESPNITINNGNISVTSTDDGLNGTFGNGGETNDGSLVKITGGNVHISSSNGDALDSNGSIQITGGTVAAHGPQSSPEVGLDVNGSATISAGTVVISGTNSNMTEGFSTTSVQYSIIAKSQTSVAANTLFHIQDASGNDVITFKPVRSYYSIIFSSPAILNGAQYKIYTGGTCTGTLNNGIYTGGTYSGGTLKKTFTISGKVTNVTF